MKPWETRIIAPDEIQQKLQTDFAKKKIVFTNGCFDILHYGHLCYLNEAKKLGDILIVALNSDQSLQEVKKHKPFMPLKHRLALIAAMSFVDLATWFEKTTPIDLLHKIRPHALVKGGDYKLEQVVGGDIVKSYGGEVFVTGHQKGLSSRLFFKKLT
jgi:D-beta-D-heptose 7-phosphate kinase/D-beta-D-heptose 1-phosphate adenosyltransferase